MQNYWLFPDCSVMLRELFLVNMKEIINKTTISWRDTYLYIIAAFFSNRGIFVFWPKIFSITCNRILLKTPFLVACCTGRFLLVWKHLKPQINHNEELFLFYCEWYVPDFSVILHVRTRIFLFWDSDIFLLERVFFRKTSIFVWKSNTWAHFF